MVALFFWGGLLADRTLRTLRTLRALRALRALHKKFTGIKKDTRELFGKDRGDKGY